MEISLGRTLGRVVQYRTIAGDTQSGTVVAVHRGGFALDVNGHFVDVSDTMDDTLDADSSGADMSCSLVQCSRHPSLSAKELSYYRDHPGDKKHFWIQVLTVCFVNGKERVFAFVPRVDPEEHSTFDVFDRRNRRSDVPPESEAVFVQIENDGLDGSRQIADFQLHYHGEFKRLSQIELKDLPQFIRDMKIFDRHLFDYLRSTAKTEECMEEVLYNKEAFPGDATSHRCLVRAAMCSKLSQIMRSCEWCRRGCYETLLHEMQTAPKVPVQATRPAKKRREDDQYQQGYAKKVKVATPPTPPARPTQPTQSTQHARQTEPKKPTRPAQHARQTQPKKSTQPTPLTPPAQLTKSARPTQLTQLTQPTQPTQSTRPTQLTQPTQSTQPAELTPLARPAQPTKQPIKQVTFSGHVLVTMTNHAQMVQRREEQQRAQQALLDVKVLLYYTHFLVICICAGSTTLPMWVKNLCQGGCRRTTMSLLLKKDATGRHRL